MNKCNDEPLVSVQEPGLEKSIPDHIREVFSQSTCLYSREDIQEAIEKMAVEITHEVSQRNPIFLCVVVGGIIPLGNLLPYLSFPLEVDYVHATRYRGKTVGSELTWKAKPSSNLKGRTVVVLDDILDGGVTLSAIVKYCEGQGAEKVYTAVLVDKKHVREPEGIQVADFTGLEVDDHYVFGFGMDYKGYLRNAPGIYRIPIQYK